MNRASNAFALCATNGLFETFCRYEINKLFNRIISKYKLRTNDIVYPRTCFANLLRYSKNRNVNLYVFLHMSRFEIIEHECDAISFVFIICSTFKLILAPGCRFFLYHHTTRIFSRILDNDFISHKAKMIRRLRSASFTIRCLAFMPRFWFYESPTIVINFYWFTNACRRLLIVGSFRAMTFEIWSTVCKTYDYTFHI